MRYYFEINAHIDHKSSIRRRIFPMPVQCSNPMDGNESDSIETNNLAFNEMIGKFNHRL